MKLVVGLGNPGKKYRLSRHNVGFMTLDKISSMMAGIDLHSENRWQYSKNANGEYNNFKINDLKVELIKPQTFMNASGKSVSYAVKKHKIPLENVFVIHDDLDIDLGEYKIVKGKGPREHKGLLDIYKKLGDKDFWHIRIGVDNRSKEDRIAGEDYVLQNFSEQEMVIVENVITEISERILEMIISGSPGESVEIC